MKKEESLYQSSVKLVRASDVHTASELFASSFVHEFKNPLTVVHGFVQLLRSDYPDLPYLDIIQDELEQLKDKTSQFLLFPDSDKKNDDESVFSVNEVLNQVSTMLFPRMLEYNVTVKKELQKEVYLYGYENEFKQVIINLLFNAIEAMYNQEKPAIIHIRGYVRNGFNHLEISNSGPKIPDDIMNKLFEPFVTTKNSGTGLGLYICKQIIEQHHGVLSCTSDENWTTFLIELPSVDLS